MPCRPRPLASTLLALALTLAAVPAAAVPGTVLVHGALSAAGGGPVADGGYALTFSLYATPKATGATWTESAASVKVLGGRFTYALGAVKPLDPKVLAALSDPELGVKVGSDPELPRVPLRSVAFALRARTAEGLSCSGCVKGGQLANGAVGAAQVAFTWAGSKTKGGPATSASDLQCTGCVSVSEISFDADVSMASHGLKAKMLAASTVAAQTVTAGSFMGDGSKLTGLPLPKGSCKGEGEAVTGIAPDGKLICAKVGVTGGTGALGKVSHGLLTDQFLRVATGPSKPMPIPDNNPIGGSDQIVFPDVGAVVSLRVKVHLVNSDISTIAVTLFDPANGQHLLFDKGGKGKTLKATWPVPDKPVKATLESWIGKNPKGIWRLKVVDSKALPGAGVDGKVVSWSLEVVTESSKQVQVNGDLLVTGNLRFTGKGQAQLMRFQNAASAPVACDAGHNGLVWLSTKDDTLYVCVKGKYEKLAALRILGATPGNPAKSCKEIAATGKHHGDGLYWIATKDTPTGPNPYQVWCDMTTDGGGWTLVASVHEDNLGAKCNAKDRWSSTKGNSPSHPAGDGNWENTATFGSPTAATTDDFKSPAYAELKAKDVMIYHVPNGTQASSYRDNALLRYHTATGFLAKYGGTMRSLFKDHYPVKWGGSCGSKGPAIPVVWDKGSNGAIDAYIAPNSKGESTPGYIHFRVFNNEKACNAVCPGIRYDGCNTEHACIGGGGWFPEGNPKQCGDFSGWDWSGYGTGTSWSASKALTEAAVFFFYR